MKLTYSDLVDGFFGARDDHPGRRGFAVKPQALFGVFYPNPEGCCGLRRPNKRRRVKR